MVRIEEIDGKNKPLIIESLKFDMIRHVLALYDILYDPQHTTAYAAFANQDFKGYIVIYTATDVTSVVLECEPKIADELLKHTPLNKFILHAPRNLLPAIKEKFPGAEHYVENWMLIWRNEASFFKSPAVRRLNGREDAQKLADLLLSRRDRPKGTVKKYEDLISKMPTYGVFKEGRLVSYAGSFIQLPQVWLIGGVYTHPNHRNRGYATQVTSAITKEALRTAEAAALFVRSGNHSAIRAYEKIGYRKIGEKVWVDVGTGLRP